MIQLGFIIAIGLTFSRLARKYKKSAILFGIVGGGLAVMFIAVTGAVLVRISPQALASKSDIVDGFKLLFLCLAFSGFLCWLMYMLIDFLWKKELASYQTSEMIDEELTEDEFS